MQLSEDLQWIQKTRNLTENQKKGQISQDNQQVYYLQVFQRMYFFFFSVLYFTSIYNVHLKIYNSNINAMFTHYKEYYLMV